MICKSNNNSYHDGTSAFFRYKPRTLMPLRGVSRKRCSENMQHIYKRTPVPKCHFSKVALQLYWNRTSTWVFSCKFAPYFQNTFSQEHLWVVASVHIKSLSKDSLNFYRPLKMKFPVSDKTKQENRISKLSFSKALTFHWIKYIRVMVY